MPGLSLPAAYTPHVLDVCESTNDEAKRLAALGEDETPDGTLVWAREQTKGRGRRGRTWASPPGNLCFSLVLRPGVRAAEAAQLGFAAALAVYDALGAVVAPGHQAHCKWPNDVLLNGAKVAGILMESAGAAGTEAPEWIVLGAGLNVVWRPEPEDVEYPATSLRAEGIEDVDAQMILESFARHFMVWSRRWLEDGFAPLRENWLWRAHGRGEPIRVRAGGKEFSGRFNDIDASGALIVETETGPVTVAAGDVLFEA